MIYKQNIIVKNVPNGGIVNIELDKRESLGIFSFYHIRNVVNNGICMVSE